MSTNFIKTALALVVATMLSQGAMATWSNHGSFEPDNSHDDANFMFVDAPGAITNRIYFNGYTGTSYGLRGALVNPNAGALQTTNEAVTLEHHMALFGVWVDCNGDGYVGIAESAMQEYPAALLADTTLCPPVTGDMNVWTAGAHNYNGWVSEYVPIAGRSDLLDNNNDTRRYADDEAMVWAENGLYTDPATAGGSCPLAPQPRGTFQSTGGLINWLECNPGLMERWNDAWNGRRLAGQDVPGITGLTGVDLGLAFDDPNNASGTWADHPTFGTENTANSPLKVWDCSAAPMLHSGSFVNSTLGPNAPAFWGVAKIAAPRADNYTVYQASPSPTGAPNPTVPAFVNSTQEGLNVLSGQEDCDTSNDDGHDFYGNNYVFYVGETDFNRVSTANKTNAAWNLQFLDFNRGELLLATVSNNPIAVDNPVFGGYAGAANPTPFGSNWNSPSVLVKAGPRTVRADLATGNVEIAPPTMFTFYGFVGQATLDRGFALPSTSVGTYAEPQCGVETSGIHNGWNCDKTLWYRNPDGSPVPEPTPLARPGQKYQFRDTDCYDGRNGLGVAVGVTAYGATPCQPYSG